MPFFVDAGYIRGRAQTKRKLAGVPPTEAIIIDETKLVDALRQFAEDISGGQLLRIYWYDGMPKHGMTAQHVRLAKLRDVKLRFGTLNNFCDQKGVDSRIIADIIELARNRAMESAVLVAGDDDLRVGIEVAQSYGVRFHVLGLQDRVNASQSQLLQQEADSVTVWDHIKTDEFIKFAGGANEVTPTTLDASASTKSSARIEAAEKSSSGLAISATLTMIDKTTSDTIIRTVAEYVATLDDHEKADIKTVYESQSVIAAPYDGRVLGRSCTALDRNLEPYEKSFMRKELAKAVLSPENSSTASSANGGDPASS